MSAITINFTDEELATLLVVADQQNIGLEDFIKIRCLRDLSDFQFEDQLLNEEIKNVADNQPAIEEAPKKAEPVITTENTDNHLVEGDLFTKPIGATPGAKPAAPQGAPLYNKRVTGNKWF